MFRDYKKVYFFWWNLFHSRSRPVNSMIWFLFDSKLIMSIMSVGTGKSCFFFLSVLATKYQNMPFINSQNVNWKGNCTVTSLVQNEFLRCFIFHFFTGHISCAMSIQKGSNHGSLQFPHFRAINNIYHFTMLLSQPFT